MLAHVPVKQMDFRPKAIFVATMTRRVLMAMDNEKLVDDRDYVGTAQVVLRGFQDAHEEQGHSLETGSYTVFISQWFRQIDKTIER